jgi:hypothetical protein
LLERIRNLLKFRLEILFLRGTHVRLLVMAAAIALISVLSGLLILAFDRDFESPRHAMWWAFLRLSDPGYLGDDQGLARRIVATALTVLGYVVFVGALVAILTQWLNQTMRDLESGLTPIAQTNHVLILGWTTRTPVIVTEMLIIEGRVERFLERFAARRLRLVVLVEQLTAALRYELRDHVGKRWESAHITMRSGSPLRLEHLKRVDFLHAAAILIPSDDIAPLGSDMADANTIKILASISRHIHDLDGDMPLLVTEIFDARKIPTARRAYAGRIEVVASDLLVARLMSITVLYEGMSLVVDQLLRHDKGSELHIWDANEAAGQTWAELRSRYVDAIPIGLVRPMGRTFASDLCPAPDRIIDSEDRVVVLSRSHEAAAPELAEANVEQYEPVPLPRDTRALKVLVMGWSDRVGDLVSDLTEHAGGGVQIDILSSVPIATRERSLIADGLDPASVNQLDGDITKPAPIAATNPALYDVVVVIASDRLATNEQSDAKTHLAYLLLLAALKRAPRTPRIIVELMDQANRTLFEADRTETIVAPLVLGNLLAHVTLRSELRAVYDDLFDAVGPRLGLREKSAYGIERAELPFGDIEEAVAHTGDVALGVLHRRPYELELNPRRDAKIKLDDNDAIVVVERAAPGC